MLNCVLFRFVIISANMLRFSYCCKKSILKKINKIYKTRKKRHCGIWYIRYKYEYITSRTKCGHFSVLGHFSGTSGTRQSQKVVAFIKPPTTAPSNVLNKIEQQQLFPEGQLPRSGWRRHEGVVLISQNEGKIGPQEHVLRNFDRRHPI